MTGNFSRVSPSDDNSLYPPRNHSHSITRMDLEAYIRIIRPVVCIQLGLLSIFGMIIQGTGFPEPIMALRTYLSASLIAASIHTINDYLDYQVDLVNAPSRPIPSRKISRSSALKYGLVLGAAGVTITLFFSPTAALLGIAIFTLTNYYSIKGKTYGFIGHLIVAFTFSTYLLYGALTITEQIKPFIWNITTLSFLYILGGEVVQSIADAEGDKLRGVKSIAITSSPKMAAFVAFICYTLMALLGIYTVTQFGVIFETYSTIIIVAITLLFLGIITLPLLMRPEKGVALKTRSRINALGLIMILAFILYLLI